MFINEVFSFDGVQSTQHNIYLVRMKQSGLLESSYGLARSPIIEQIPNNPLSNFYGFQYEPLRFTVELYLEGIWTAHKKRAIATWLFKNSYKPFISMDATDIVYNCIAVGNPTSTFNGISQGIITIEFQCDAPWAWSSSISESFNLTNNITQQTISLENKSNLNDYKHYPELEFTLQGSTGFSLKNVTNSGKTTTFTDLQDGELIYMDNAKKIIKSSLIGTYRYNKFNKVWLELLYGVNYIQITGKGTLTVRSKFPIIT